MYRGREAAILQADEDDWQAICADYERDLREANARVIRAEKAVPTRPDCCCVSNVAIEYLDRHATVHTFAFLSGRYASYFCRANRSKLT